MNSGQTQVTGGGTNAPWNWGVSPFDLQSIVQAFNQASTATTNRYNQLGLGGSTMEAQDLGTAPSVTGGLSTQEQALIGQEQTANVGNAALNPALQPQINETIGANTSGQTATALGNLAGQALGGSTAASTSDAALGSSVESALGAGALA